MAKEGENEKEEKIKLTERGLELFERFLNIVKGKVDIKYRLKLLLEPDNLKTTTRLSRSQVDFVTISLFVAKHFSRFKPLADFAKEFMEVNISLQGLGREEAIRYESAISESKLLENIGIFQTTEAKPKLRTRVKQKAVDVVKGKA